METGHGYGQFLIFPKRGNNMVLKLATKKGIVNSHLKFKELWNIKGYEAENDPSLLTR